MRVDDDTIDRNVVDTTNLTGGDNYFEDFVVGDFVRHFRGKTLTEMDNVLITTLVMNTAEGHFNEHKMAAHPLRHRVVNGGIVAALVIGLATEDTAENAVAEVGLDKAKFTAPVYHGDTLYAYTQVLRKNAVDDSAGVVGFKHWGVNQDNVFVFECERDVLIRCRNSRRRDEPSTDPLVR